MEKMNFPKNITYHLFSTCIVIKGINRSCVYDLQRGDFDYVPNTLTDILLDTKESTFDKLYNSFASLDDKKVINHYFNFLNEKEYIFFSKLKKKYFPKISNEFNRPYNISTLVVDIDNSESEFLKLIKKNIIDSKVECLVLRILNSDFDNILKILIFLDGIQTRIIQLFVDKNVCIEESQIEQILEVNNRTSIIYKLSNLTTKKE